MVNIHEKTLQDLEFHIVLEQVSEHCITPLGNEKAMQIMGQIKDRYITEKTSN